MTRRDLVTFLLLKRASVQLHALHVSRAPTTWTRNLGSEAVSVPT